MRGVRPCHCDDCHHCRLFHTDARYNLLWGGKGVVGAGLCKHLGAAVRLHECEPCRAKTGHRTALKVFACAKHGECTAAMRVPGVAGCCADGCREDWPAQPEYVAIDHGRLLPGHNFNCSVAVHQGRRVFAWRRNWSHARVRLALLGDDWQPTRCLPPAWIDPPGYQGHEDPRLFLFQGKLHCSYTAYNGCRTDVGYQRFRDDLTAEAGWVLDVPGRRPWEKNWVMFEWEDGLYAVYTSTPHVVLRIDGGKAERAYETPWSPRWTHGEIRGGCPPVRVGDEFYHFFHSRLENGQGGLYALGLYTFEAKPPFRVRRFYPRPLVLPRLEDRPEAGLQPACVVYPGGAVLDDETCRIACGWMDCGCRIFRFPRKQIEQGLEAL